MSQPHPPIPEPQQQPAEPADEAPRTQSILMPPSRRQGEPAEDPTPPEVRAGEPPVEPAPEWAPPAEQPSPAQPLPGQPGPPTTSTSEFAPAPAHQFEQPPSGRYDQPATGPFPQPGYDPASPTQATGPVDFVPGFPPERPTGHPAGSSAAPPRPARGPSTNPGSPAPAQRRSPLAALQSAGRGSTVLLSLGLGVVALVLLELGLVLDFGDRSLWDVVPTWSAFATVAAVVVLAPAVAGLTGRVPVALAWRVGAGGLVALATAWVLVALPLAASDRGFWFTAAVAVAGAALWLAPGRPE
jgi:hypothetical protein